MLFQIKFLYIVSVLILLLTGSCLQKKTLLNFFLQKFTLFLMSIMIATAFASNNKFENFKFFDMAPKHNYTSTKYKFKNIGLDLIKNNFFLIIKM